MNVIVCILIAISCLFSISVIIISINEIKRTKKMDINKEKADLKITKYETRSSTPIPPKAPPQKSQK